MQRRLLNPFCVLLLFVLLACTTSPAGPSISAPVASPSPFANVVGDYRLTIEIDDKCAQIPPALKVRAFEVALEDEGLPYIPVRVIGERFGHLGGDLWRPGSDSRYRFEWNNFDFGGCDYPETIGATQLYLCGDGTVTLSESTLSGVIVGKAFLEGSPYDAQCTGASHRVALVRQAK
jgi:hypothetical protein